MKCVILRSIKNRRHTTMTEEEKDRKELMERAAEVKRCTLIGLVVNAVLSALKIAAGIVGRSGAMIADGVLDGVDACFGQHVWWDYPAGTVAVCEGAAFASCDMFEIDVTGKSGHGAEPQASHDATVMASAIVQNLQTIVSRDVSPFEPAVVTIGELHAGSARNVIAGEAYLAGTVRTYGARTHEAMPTLIKRIATHIAQALGAEATLTEYTRAHPAVVNDTEAAKRCRRAVVRVLGEDAVGSYQGTLSGEDFSLYLERVPGVLAFVGTRNPAAGATFAQHSCYYTVDESVLAKGVALTCQYTVDFLAENE